jgi:hypothetical protein
MIYIGYHLSSHAFGLLKTYVDDPLIQKIGPGLILQFQD